MARATVALLLTAALYLGITLLSSTDENLLLNAQVAVLQVGFGMALEQSYIFGPPIFLYLHVQGLFLLNILARKVRRFKDTLGQEPSGIPESCREEYWNWLSAFAFVQLFRDDHFHFVPRSLMWISMAVIPLLLLFAVDLSFVRYQSWVITYSHHVVFILDFVFVMLSRSLRFEGCLRLLWNDLSPKLKEVIISRLATIWSSLRNSLDRWFSSGDYRRSRNCIDKAIRTLFRVVVWPFRTWPRFAGFMLLFLFIEVRPPCFDVISVEEIVSNKEIIDEINKNISSEITMRGIFELVMIQKRNRIWRLDDQVVLENDQKEIIEIIDEWQSKSLSNFLYKMWKSVRDVSVLDIVPCQWWGFACRYLSVKGLWLVSTPPADVYIPKNDESDEGISESIQWSSLNELSLAGRNLRFADFRFAKLQGVNLEGAELQGANLDRADLRDADLSRAKMDGAFLSAAKLQHANFSKAELRSANLHRANLQRADLYRSQLWNVNLRNAKLQRANFTEAELQGTDMKSAYMDGAFLFKAKLTCTNLQNAQLRGTSFVRANLLGTDLGHAQLQGAKFQEAKLLGTNLAKSQLEGIDFDEAIIKNSFGTPESWKLAWLPKGGIDTDKCPEKCPASFFAELSDGLSEIESYIPVLWRKEEDNLQDCVKSIPKKVTNNDWLSKDALPKGKWVVYKGKLLTIDGIPHSVDEIHHVVPEYRKAWTKWTVGFACKNEYTGYSSVKRWNSNNPLRDLEGLICPSKNNGQTKQCTTFDEMKQYIIDELDNVANDKNVQCPGLRTVPNGGWRISDSDWREAWKDDD